MKVRVKILDSIAGLADPDTEKLNEKYEKIVSGLKGRDKPPTDKQIENHINEFKKSDRYHEKPLGFKKDWAFKPGDEAFVEESLAKRWAESEICTILRDEKAKVA